MTTPLPTSPPNIKTRILIISDTHGAKPSDRPGTTLPKPLQAPVSSVPTSSGYSYPLPDADVVLHCGDLTRNNYVSEYHDTLGVLRSHPAPLKLVIAGNHDLTLDPAFWIGSGRANPDAAEVRRAFEDAERDGVRLLAEGEHSFDLANGARFRIFASPYTPAFGGWAFQYDNGAHDFDIPPGVDVAMTHGPPLGILDRSRLWNNGTDHAGCPRLMAAIRRSRPQIHCFGHIHEAWGGCIARWANAEDGDTKASMVNIGAGIDEANSIIVKTLQDFDSGDGHVERGVRVDLTQGPLEIRRGEQTLFVNAAIMNLRYRPLQQPWVADIHLPKADAVSVQQNGS